MTKMIHVFLQPDGKKRIETTGYAGEGCKQATKALEDRFGGKVESDVPTDEANLQPEQQRQSY